MMKKLLTLVILTLVLSTLLLGGCGDTTTSTATTTQTSTSTTTQTSVTTTTTSVDAPQYGGTLKYISAYSPSGPFGWPLDTDWVQMYMTNYVFAEPLILYNADGTVEPWLAESWDFSNENKTVTFKLRKNVKFHDGTAFNADAVKYQFDTCIAESKAVATNWASVEIVDDYTVNLNLKEFKNSLWDDLRNKNCMIVSPTNVRDNGLDYAREHPVGTGPFKFVSFERDVSAIFEKNTDYWQEGKPYLDRLEFIFVKEMTTQKTLMQTGDGHVLTALGGRDLYDMVNLGFDTYTYAAGVELLEPDSANPDSIFADKKVRLAMDYAVDRQAICDALGYGFMYPNNQIIPNPAAGFNPDIPMREYSVEKAKALLTEAGYPDGFKTTLLTQAMFSQLTLIIQEQFKLVGIDAEIQTLDNAAYWESSATGWNDGIWVTGNSFSPNYASAFRSIYPPYGNLHKSVYIPDALVTAMDAAILTNDYDEQISLTRAMAQAAYDETMVIVIDSSAMGYAVSPKVHDGQWLKGADWQYWNPANTWLEK